MKKTKTLTEGKIFTSLFNFAVPVICTLFLQALYGGVDLLVVGQFAATEDVSGVATGSMLLHAATMIVMGLTMGITVAVGERIGRGRPGEAGQAIGSGICLFGVFAVLMTAVIGGGAEFLAGFLHAPEAAFSQTVEYVRICGLGSVFIVAYNVLGSVFRGIGDSKTPLFTVTIACAVNIAGDLLFVACFGMGAAGAALATVAAQAVSVLISLLVIRKRQLPFAFSREDLRFHRQLIGTELRIGVPVALQELLVGISFLVIQTIVNTFGVVPSAGVGVAEKVCTFIMLVPSAYMQSMSAFVAQNLGAGRRDRADLALCYGMATSFAAGAVMGCLAFFHGNLLAEFFSRDAAVILAAHSYLKAYAIDCLLTPFLFCFVGYYNGCEKTLFVMLQGIIGAFFVRIPVAYLISGIPGASLFQLGLATPASSVVQIVLCLVMFVFLKKRIASGR
ncbi:MAG: MATE family efflux transporter [Clostridium sp.]|jgi:putative MATE family efflux protein